jgi:hypothetical protein
MLMDGAYRMIGSRAVMLLVLLVMLLLVVLLLVLVPILARTYSFAQPMGQMQDLPYQ